MRIIQVLTTIAFGDAVSNDVLAIRDILSQKGFETGIYAEHIDTRLPDGTARVVGELPRLDAKDIMIYHASTGTQLNFDLPKLPGRKMMIYHNITPAEFFEGYSPDAVRLTTFGYEGMRYLSDKVSCCVADSDYNRQDLRKLGYTCPIEVCPIIIPFEDYDREPDRKIIDQYASDGWTNLLFVGRIAPNKKQEDIIRAFYCYQRDYNPRSRLFLVGNSGGMEKYESRLTDYVNRLGLKDKVIFPGHIGFDAILAYYRLADVFVCMSEHEGFCVPIVEAMHFGIPIVAYSSAAIPETLGKGGLLLDDKDPYLAAAAIDRLVRDRTLRDYISDRQREKLEEYRYETVRKRLVDCLDKLLGSQAGEKK